MTVKFYIFIFIVFMSLLAFGSYLMTQAYFTDTAVSGVNTFTAAVDFGGNEEEPPATQSGTLVINEVYYDVAEDKGDEGNSQNPDEWIELYNPTSFSVDIKDWSIGDANDDDNVSTAQKTVPPGGYVLVSKSNSTWSKWDENENALQLPIGDKIGDGLANTGDVVILKDNNGIVVDMVSWGTNTTAFNPAVSAVAEGHSIERNPAGHDTGIAGDFVDRSSPTPGN